MGGVRELSRPPRMSGLALRAGLAMIPGASALPGVAGGAREVPDLALTLSGARLEPLRLAAYTRLCGYAPGGTLPPTAPHLLAFPLHMALMTDGSFPLRAVGLVHVANRIEQRRAIGVDERLQLRVRATALQEHARGRAFTIVTEALAGGEPVWEERSTMLRRETPRRDQGRPPASPGAPQPLGGEEEWALPEDLGRRYARVSGDRNPIHLHALSARPFGFPSAIAHGMWSKARCLAAMQDTLPEAFTVNVGFGRPVLLPARVRFGRRDEPGGTRFALRGAGGDGALHMHGTVGA